jgi:3-isopropylmalate/(R)-2-methylmalate dehydratase large subunit
MNKLKVRRINVTGKLGPGVTAKDVILHILKELGVNGGTGYAYEYGGEVFDNFTMEERMTVCNMSIEGGARCGYINPDETTFAYLKGRPYAPQGADWDAAVEEWKSLASQDDADYHDVVDFDASQISPTVTWGINPGQGIAIGEPIPQVKDLAPELQSSATEALEYMGFSQGQKLEGIPVDVVFIGSCTNGRLSDLKEAARVIQGRKVAPNVTALCVPGSQIVAKQAEEIGLDKIFTDAGFQWRQAGCSMCLAMNPDKLVGRQLCASTSNRNFKGRQGSPTGRTILMSPVMAVAAALEGKISDARKVFGQKGE